MRMAGAEQHHVGLGELLVHSPRRVDGTHSSGGQIV
jgi:hypothetical protein